MRRIAKVLAALALACLAFGARAEPAASVASGFQLSPYGLPAGVPAPHASLYAFADVFRLTVGGAAFAAQPSEAPTSFQIQALADMPVRVATIEPQLAGYTFTVVSMPEPQLWLLLLSGLAAAGWVARRRLMNSF